jgi:hypothetical protein
MRERAFLLLVDFPSKKQEYSWTMPLSAINEIEREFERLSPEAQLSLLERLQRHVRVSVSGGKDPWEDELAAMAVDPQVRREIECFTADTPITEADGLQGD